MKNISLLLASMLVLLLLNGCTDNGTGENTYDQNQPQQIQSTIPAQDVGIGSEYDLAAFMFAYPPLNNQNAEKEFLVTTQNAQGFFETDKSYIKRVQEGLTDDLGDKIINIFENNSLIEHAVVNETRISVTFYQNQLETGTEQYRRYFRLHEDMFRSNEGACVYKDIWENGLDISEIIPLQANPNSGSAHFAKVLQVYCGTREGTKIDRYYADGWGIIAEVIQSATGETVYSVFDQSSYKMY
jgi:hypothetical protein